MQCSMHDEIVCLDCSHAYPIGLTKEDSNFLDHLVNLNPLLVKKIEPRMPKYKWKRFANNSDVYEALAIDVSVRNIDTEAILNKLVSSNTLKNLENGDPVENLEFSVLLRKAEERISGAYGNANGRGANLSWCTPWLNKEKPRSVTESRNNLLNGKIYASISVNHSVADDFLYFQETYTDIGYISPLFSAIATVAFPPVCEGEVWTIGWIQAMTKCESTIESKDEYNQYFKLVFCILNVFTIKLQMHTFLKIKVNNGLDRSKNKYY